MSTTRLLVLGLVVGHGTTHGYAIHHELVLWDADKWANVKWGSIYHALRQLTKEGKLASVEDPSGRVDYRITDEGHEAFMLLLRGALSDGGAHADLLSAGLAFLTALPRAEAIALLERRRAALEEERERTATIVGAGPDRAWKTPGTEHVPEMFALWHGNADHALQWTSGLIERLRGGAYTMADDVRA
ncbi:PadR family transcriptional regulator [Nocardiopsis ansamitocini]|uniref:PadR family transcriptional regulator n=1 Tax=Nocardiopsis ansamitocini TaxID=1670832 RepID=A0A9W6P7E4_9ACTN|nr:PadR family transcriptional regulator [Nocardiopsis ansamitocini]GLU48403.1 PadR family transcriptional regulator [Nocardiopsis ansamitocini]